MSNVICLNSVRLEKQSRALAYKAGSLDIDFSDIERICSFNEDGTPNLSLDNPIVMGLRAKGQVRELFWRYGLRQMPLTWGELHGNWNYCRLLHLWLMAMSPDESDSVIKGLEARHNQRSPGRGDLLRLLMNGDLDLVHAWHVEHNIFKKNAEDPKLASTS